MIQMSTPRRTNFLLALLACVLMTAHTFGADTILHNFGGSASEGQWPVASLTLVGSRIYGTTRSGGTPANGTIFAMNTDGTGYTILRNNFAGAPWDGAGTWASLTLVGSTLYGTTRSGGGSNYGTVFAMNTNGTGFTILHNFGGAPWDGAAPSASLTLVGSTLYGTTVAGGAYTNYSGTVSGTVFAINTNGTGYTILHEFGSVPGDGANVQSAVIVVGSRIYGTTAAGGAYTNSHSYADGTVFAMNTNGTDYTILHNFGGDASDGQSPVASLTLVGSTLYGTAIQGGSYCCGIIFALNTNGTGYTILHSFGNSSTDAKSPDASLTPVGSVLFGTTENGGENYNYGTVYAINTNGTGFTIVHSFAGPKLDGSKPYASVVLGGSNLYGVTAYGGVYNQYGSVGGTVFTLPLPNLPLHTRIIGLSGNLAFGSVPVGTGAQQVLTITNSGNSALSVSGISYPSGFSGAWSGTIPTGGSQNVSVIFSPTAALSYGETLAVNSDANSGTNTLAISGMGICTYTLSITSATVAATASNAGFMVYAGNGCAWSAVSGVGWIHTSSTGNGNGSVGYSVDGNGTTSSRTGAVTVAGQVCTILQTGNSPPQVSIAAVAPITWPTHAVNLNATVTDDGAPYGTVTTAWSEANGPGTVSFGNAGSINTTVTFSTNGTYLLDLVASDGVLSSTGNVTVIVNLAPVVTTPPGVTNSVADIGGIPVVLPGDPVTFTVGAVDPQSNDVACLWNFGDGQTSTDCEPSHVFSNCGPHTVAVALNDGISTTTTGLVVTVACPLEVSGLSIKVNFPVGKLDTAQLKGFVQLPVGYSVTNLAAQLEIGEVAVSVTLSPKGIGLNGYSSLKLQHKGKPTNLAWQVTGKFKSDFDSIWASNGLTNATVRNVSITMPVLLLLDSDPPEAFYVERAMIYTATTGKSGAAK